ncbi:hypothetical protein [Caulobacter sp. Root655]|uniref:hypothetical protein n=1 Tax=Caulobacter sp. Root655 TaxID=1736578 RepID=UPI000AB6BAAD|nr:hypothetical protein [Caulobacter sp. Root655]
MSRTLAAFLIGMCVVGCTEGEPRPGGGGQSIAIRSGEFTGKQAIDLAREIPIPNAGQIEAAHVQSTPVGTERSSSYVVDFWGPVAASDASDLCTAQKVSLILERKFAADASQKDLLKDYAVTEVRAAPVFKMKQKYSNQEKGARANVCSFVSKETFFSAENYSVAFLGYRFFTDMMGSMDYPLVPGSHLQDVRSMPCETDGAVAEQCLSITVLRNKAAGEEFYADIIAKIELGPDGVGGEYKVTEKKVILRRRVF